VGGWVAIRSTGRELERDLSAHGNIYRTLFSFGNMVIWSAKALAVEKWPFLDK
jgi:hypothetical protein